MKINNKRGVSLIVLIITIIVMIILAGTIIMTLSNDGIIDKASEAVEMTNLETVREIAQTAWATAYASGIRTVEDNGSTPGFETRIYDALEANKVDWSKYDIRITTIGVTVELKGE